MLAAVTRSAPNAIFRYLAVGTVLHAALIALLWVGDFYFEVWEMPGRVWLLLSWLWLAWPILLLLHPGRSPIRVLLPTFVGLALLAPCLTTIWSFTVWSIGGFAP
jgi:hypothetical protein